MMATEFVLNIMLLIGLIMSGGIIQQISCTCLNNKKSPNSKLQEPSFWRKFAVDGFGLDLFKRVSMVAPHENVLLSPFSIRSAFHLAYFGAEGQTRAQLENVLNISSDKDDALLKMNFLNEILKKSVHGSTRLKNFNKAYFDQGIRISQCAKNSIVNIKVVDFRDSVVTANKINEKIANQTEGKIKDLLTPGDIAQARFVLVNAIYFNALWVNQFNIKDTRLTKFKDEYGNIIGEVPMMHQKDTFKYAKVPESHAHILELPYADSSISMYILKPEEGVTTVTEILQSLTPDTLDHAISQLRHKEVQIGVPKFKIEKRLDGALKSVMQDLGATNMFDPSRSDLSSFSRDESLVVDSTVHVAFTVVHEKGTEAAAATVLIGTRSGPGTGGIQKFICDVPFVFLIREHVYGTTLFAGVYRTPLDTKPIL